MPLNIKSERADRLARELAELTGESLTDAVSKAVEERLERRRRPQPASRRPLLRSLRRLVASLQIRDHRPDDELLGYDRDGLFR